MRRDPSRSGSTTRADVRKATDHIGHEQIIRLSREMGVGLKTLRLVSPPRLLSPTECAPGENPIRFPFSQEIPRSIPT